MLLLLLPMLLTLTLTLLLLLLRERLIRGVLDRDDKGGRRWRRRRQRRGPEGDAAAALASSSFVVVDVVSSTSTFFTSTKRTKHLAREPAVQAGVKPRDGLLVGQGDEGARVGLRRVGGAVVCFERGVAFLRLKFFSLRSMAINFDHPARVSKGKKAFIGSASPADQLLSISSMRWY